MEIPPQKTDKKRHLKSNTTTPPPSPPFCNPSTNTARSLPSPRTPRASCGRFPRPERRLPAGTHGPRSGSSPKPTPQPAGDAAAAAAAVPSGSCRSPAAAPGWGRASCAGGSATPEPQLPHGWARYRERQRPPREAELSFPGTHHRQPRRCRRGDEEVPAPLPLPGVTRGAANAQGGPGPRRARGGPGISFSRGRGTVCAPRSWKGLGLRAPGEASALLAFPAVLEWRGRNAGQRRPPPAGLRGFSRGDRSPL